MFAPRTSLYAYVRTATYVARNVGDDALITRNDRLKYIYTTRMIVRTEQRQTIPAKTQRTAQLMDVYSLDALGGEEAFPIK